MRLSTGPVVLTRWGLPFLAAATVASCSEVTATSRELAHQPSLDASAADQSDAIINDEEWRGLTPEETPEEVTTASETAADPSVTVADLPPEPIIRVGVLYAELLLLSLPISGGDAADAYDLHRRTAGGLIPIVSGVSGETVAAIVGSGAGAQIKLTLPGGATHVSSDPVVLTSASGYIRTRSPTSSTARIVYYGRGEIGFNSTRTRLVAINELPIERYIKGVVPRELGPVAFPEVEAQKAQAVTARTFARRRMVICVSRCAQGYHIIPTTGDQVYGGSAAEHPVSSAAVDATRGIVATHPKYANQGGGLIDALYSSTSGGWTANSEDVFPNAFDYLRGVPDHERGKALDHVPSLDVFRNHGNPTNLRNHANGDFEADWSIFHRWYVHWTKEEMRQTVGRIQLPPGVMFIDPGEVHSIDVVSRSESGRVFEMRFVTEKRGTLTATKDAIRTALRYVTYNAAGIMVFNSLRSILVYVEPEIDPKTKAIVGWEAWGGGWGHGVGMSQTGAVGMAEKGHSYQEILEHYYQGVVVEKRWE
jgi:SpoIID/LytB domain protein